jgi:2,3-bisphosphoglycerate-dependent phosphoglycerate mutase
MYKIVLLRHGLSTWNLENRFTGWSDIDLATEGITEAHKSGQVLRKAGFQFDIAYTSLLKRAIRTLWITLDELDQMWIPVVKDWRLNERHCGILTGLEKEETARKYGQAQVSNWIDGASIIPPLILKNYNDPRYSKIEKSALPNAESLQDTIKRVSQYWDETLSNEIRSDKRLLIVAHRITLRALIKHLEHISDEAIVKRIIPNAIPLVYELDVNLQPICHYYLNNNLNNHEKVY